jgi:hypothetical protein
VELKKAGILPVSIQAGTSNQALQSTRGLAQMFSGLQVGFS